MRDPVRLGARLTQDDFAALVDRYQQRLHAFLAGLLGAVDGAFDLVQDTFAEAWQAALRGAPPFMRDTEDLEVRRWLFRAGYHNAISLLRRCRLIRWETLDAVDATPLADSLVSFDERLAESDALARAMARLAPPDVAILLLRVVHDFSAAEVGTILNTSAANVNNRLARAKQRLRASYLSTNQLTEERLPR